MATTDSGTEATNGDLVEVELGARGNAAASTAPPAGQQESAGRRRRRGARAARRLIRRLSPASVARACKRWLRHPAHLALLAWALCVAAAGTMLGLLLLGVLNGAFPRKAARNRWIEIDNQILNALFTLMSIYQHPALFHHAVLLLRWRAGDGKELRKAYCRKGGGGAARRERLHMSVVVALLHLTCFAQYAMCGLYWGYSRKARPDAAETSLAVIGTATPVLAGLYMYFSPLGRKRELSVHLEPDDDHHHGGPVDAGAAEAEVVVTVTSPEWAGGLLDVGDDPTACWLSFLCTFCVFGWNMERLGFGNMHVHAVMFALLCFAPLWVLNVAAMNIRDEAVGDMVGAAGVVLCALGLLYGGFWRARMRRRFVIAGDAGACCGSSALADYLRWMFCWGCALAQEVRTANLLLLDVEAGSVVGRRDSDGDQAVDTTLQPLPRENRVKSSSCQAGSAAAIADDPSILPANSSPCRDEESPFLQLKQDGRSSSGEMSAPVPPLMPEGERRGLDGFNTR